MRPSSAHGVSLRLLVGDCVASDHRRPSPCGRPDGTGADRLFPLSGGPAPVRAPRNASAGEGYFTFGDAIGFGRLHGAQPARAYTTACRRSRGAITETGAVRLPFDLAEVVTNLQQERYRRTSPGGLERITTWPGTQRAYYFLRPLLPVAFRKHLQRIRLSGWERIPFPRWPVDFSVDTLMQGALGAGVEEPSRQGDSVHLVLARRGVELRDDDARRRRRRPGARSATT